MESRGSCVGYTTEIFIDKAKKIHGKLYDYSKVNYIDSKTKIIIVCKEHGEYLQTPSKHLQKQGCPKCMCYEKSNSTEFIEKAKQIYGNKYDYSKVEYVNSQTKIMVLYEYFLVSKRFHFRLCFQYKYYKQ